MAQRVLTSIPSPAIATLWKRVKEAHDLLILDVHVQLAIQKYEHLLSQNYVNICQYIGTSEDTWEIWTQEAQPSQIELVLHLAPYFLRVQLWNEWLDLFEQELVGESGYKRVIEFLHCLVETKIWRGKDSEWLIPDETVARIVFYYAWCFIENYLSHLNPIKKLLIKAMKKLKLSSTKGLYEIWLAQISLLQRKEKDAINYGERALKELQDSPLGFFKLKAHVILASIYGAFKDKNSKYIEKSRELYQKDESLIRSQFPDAEPELPHYSYAWLLAETRQYTSAIEEFEKGARIASQYGFNYDFGRCLYGKAYALARLAKLQSNKLPLLFKAQDCIVRARDTFIANKEHKAYAVMMAVCLHTEAIIYQYSNHADRYQLAFQRVNLGLEWLQERDDLVRKQNLLRSKVLYAWGLGRYPLSLFTLSHYLVLRFLAQKWR